MFIERNDPPDMVQIEAPDWNSLDPEKFRHRISIDGENFKLVAVSNDWVLGLVETDVTGDVVLNEDHEYFYPVPLQDAAVQDTCRVLLITEAIPGQNATWPDSDSNNATDEITDAITVVLLDDYTPPQYQFPQVEASPPNFRKVGLDGWPLPDGLPVGGLSSDSGLAGAFVDALSLRLHYNVTDVSVKTSSSSFPLLMNRRSEEYTWNKSRGLAPGKELFQAFGPGWTSIIGAHVKTIASPGETGTAEVIDHTGTRHRFVRSHNFVIIEAGLGEYHPLAPRRWRPKSPLAAASFV